MDLWKKCAGASVSDASICSPSKDAQPETGRSLPRPIPMADFCEPPLHRRGATVCSTVSDQADADLLVHVPGTIYEACVSRQVLLMEVLASLGLDVHSQGTVAESGKLRGWIRMDVPPGKGQIHAAEETFYGELKDDTHHAMESAADAVLEHLVDERGVQINDANYGQVLALRRRLQAATDFEDICREDNQATQRYIKAVGESSQALLHQICKMCA